MFEDTKNCKAMFYLDDYGREVERVTFLEGMLTPGMAGFMLYVGPGYVPLTAAVLAYDAVDAYDIFEDWCRRTGRPDEINEENPDDPCFGEYESHCERIPRPVVVMPGEEA